MKHFGENLREMLLDAIMSQKELADKAGLTPCSISNYIRGVSEPRTSTLLKIANALNCTTDDLVLGKRTRHATLTGEKRRKTNCH